MPKKRFSAEQIVVVLRQIEVLMSQGKAAPVACREAGISQQSYYRWRKEYGGLELHQLERCWRIAVFRGAGRQSGRPGVRRDRTYPGCLLPPAGAARGLQVSRCNVLEYLLLKR